MSYFSCELIISFIVIIQQLMLRLSPMGHLRTANLIDQLKNLA